jgi:hypothetical protein
MQNAIANNILAQLGGAKFCAMTGARQLVAGDDSLQFRIGAGAVNKATHVRITLEPSDLYKVEFFKVRGTRPVQTCGEPLHGVYADQLQATFTSSTGLDTHL